MQAGLFLLAVCGTHNLLPAQDSHWSEPPFTLWTGGEIPNSKDLPLLKGVEFRVVKKYEPQVDGYQWLHGAAIVRHKDQWVASFGHNRGHENTGTELAQSRFSRDGGNTWGDMVLIDSTAGDIGISHGVFMSQNDTLWAFQGAFYKNRQLVHMRAYHYDEARNTWIPKKGIAAECGFWPLQEPQQMNNGHWIMAGASIGGNNPPAVAICKNGNFSRWEIVKIPTPEIRGWGESSVIIDGSRILLISRAPEPFAWVSVSNDYGETWSKLQPSNLPMAGSKPYTGTLSNGTRYLIGTMTADAKHARHPLTIAVSRKGENTFTKIYAIRHAVHNGPGESHPNAALCYPYAVEYKGALWVVYSNGGDRRGNRNSMELAIIPIKELDASK